MVVEFIELLKHAEEYECCWRDEELYVRLSPRHLDPRTAPHQRGRRFRIIYRLQRALVCVPMACANTPSLSGELKVRLPRKWRKITL